MSYFKDAEDAYRYLGGVFRAADEHPEVGQALRASGITLRLEYTARNQACFDIPTHGEPWKKIRILKNETALCARSKNFFLAHKQLAGIRKIETGNESKQCRFSATARPD